MTRSICARLKIIRGAFRVIIASSPCATSSRVIPSSLWASPPSAVIFIISTSTASIGVSTIPANAPKRLTARLTSAESKRTTTSSKSIRPPVTPFSRLMATWMRGRVCGRSRPMVSPVTSTTIESRGSTWTAHPIRLTRTCSISII